MKRVAILLTAVVVLVGLAIRRVSHRPRKEAVPTEAPAPERTAEPQRKPVRDEPPEEIPPELRARMESVIGVPVPRQMTYVTIPAFRGELKVGDTVDFEAKVMGAMKPFIRGEARFLVGDELTVASCDLLGIEEKCPTPWDVHHEEPGAVARGAAWIRIADAQGNVIPAGVKGVKGLAELSRLRIRGRVAELPQEGKPVIDALAIQILD